ncbi:hypothetical protein MHH28_07045 [Paenibacillus sp. FSL K6-1217]
MRRVQRSGKDLVSVLLGVFSILIIAFFVIRYVLQTVSFAP